jgi:lipoprotein-releasing system permease protein
LGSHNLNIDSVGVQGIVVGKRLAEKLEIKPGERVLLFALPVSSLSLRHTRIMQFDVRGVYETGMAEFDESYVYMNIKSAQQLFQIGDAVSGFDILVHNTEKLPELTKQLSEYLGYPYYARSMQQMHRNLFTWIDLQKKPVPIILGLIIIVATVNIIGTLLMMVMEKTKEIGILRALGTGRVQIVRIFLFQGMLIGVVGTVLGNVVAFVLCWLELHYRIISLPSGIYYMSHVPIDLNALNFLFVSAASLLLCFISSLVPSRIAAALDPITTLRFAS